ncbi:hypothetical protein ACTMTJ_44900 [Phytohabitans sp. LJ34]|uniref:hypothetical protein n=1 Tax=Phytohabitans sp. LJ34 TaxID=3452217 RepID=UPI003F8A430A
MQKDDLRERLRRRLRRRDIDDLWAYLDQQHYVTEFADDLDRLVDTARAVLKAGRAARRPAARQDGAFGDVADPRRPPKGLEQAWARSLLVAAEASRHEAVEVFRARNLPGGLLAWSDVQTWLEDQKAIEGPITNDITVTVETDWLDYRGRGHMVFDPPIAEARGLHLASRDLAYAVPGGRWVNRFAIRADGQLNQLRLCAESLAEVCGWQPAQATVFVLTGVTPLISSVRIKTSVVGGGKITLTIEPTASSEDVLNAYHAARRERGIDHLRTLSVKHARLAAFALVEYADVPWDERWNRWNRAEPRWAYSKSSNFRRDALAAAKRLLDPDSRRRDESAHPSIFFDDPDPALTAAEPTT